METKQGDRKASRKSDRILDPSYCENLPDLPDDQLKARHDESVELEHELSYSRRLLQGKIDIQKHALKARQLGAEGSMQALIDALPSILADDGASAPATRNSPVAPPVAPEGRREADGLTGLVADIEKMTLEELSGSIERLSVAENATSESRKKVQKVIDGLNAELVRRLSGQEGATQEGATQEGATRPDATRDDAVSDGKSAG
ncbi:MAG: hypothetical protein ACR2FO_05040 [Actinomycetota bacterium]